MGSAAEITEPTTGTEKHRPVEVEEEDEQIVDLERKTSPFRHGKGLYSDNSTITTTNTSTSSSFSGDGPEGSPYFRNGEEEHVSPENLEVPESPEQDSESGFLDENNCNVYFDGEQGSESAGAESENGEKKQSESENGSLAFEGSREIEEVTEGNLIEELDAVDQPTGDVIEEEVEIDDAEDYDVEKVLDNQETHDLFCPNCNSCITKRVVLKRRKRKIRHVLEDPKRMRGTHLSDPILHSEDNFPSADAEENSVHESFMFKCLSCFSIFIPKGVGSKPNSPNEGVEELRTQPIPQEEGRGDSNWFSSIFGFSKKGSAVQPGGAMPSVPEANPRDNVSLLGEDTTGSTAINPSKAPALVQGDAVSPIQDGPEMSASQDKKPVDTSLIQAEANSDDTSKVVNNGAIVEDGQKVLIAPLVEEQTLQKMDKDVPSPAEGNHTSLSPIQPSHDMNIVNKVTTGPEGIKIETTFHSEGGPHMFEGTDTSEISKPDFGLAKVTTGVMENGDRVVISSPPSTGIDIPPVSSLEEGTLREPLIIRPVVEGRKLEVLKSIVYGGLIEAITSLGVISSAAASGASTLNILVLGLANILGGLILIIHNLQELRDEEPRRTTTNGQVEEEGRYKRLLGRRENFTLHATVAILSFIIVGLIPPVVYAFSFSKSHNRDYKVASVFGSSLLCIVLLALAKARVKTPRGSYYKSVLYYAMIAVSVSGISYVVGNFLEMFLEKNGWSQGSKTPAGQTMLSLMGRKAGSFGYSSSY